MFELAIKLTETPRQLAEGAGYKGYVVDQGVVSASRLFEEAARGTSWNANELECAFNQVMATAYRGLQTDGRSRMLGKWFKMMLTVRGRFESKGESFDDERHSLIPRLLPLSAIKAFKRQFKVKVENAGPLVKLASLRSVSTPESPILVWGDDIVVTGENLTLLSEDAVTTMLTDRGATIGSQEVNHRIPIAGATATEIRLPWSAVCRTAYEPVSPSLTFEIVSRGGIASANPQRHRIRASIATGSSRCAST